MRCLARLLLVIAACAGPHPGKPRQPVRFLCLPLLLHDSRTHGKVIIQDAAKLRRQTVRALVFTELLDFGDEVPQGVGGETYLGADAGLEGEFLKKGGGDGGAGGGQAAAVKFAADLGRNRRGVQLICRHELPGQERGVLAAGEADPPRPVVGLEVFVAQVAAESV